MKVIYHVCAYSVIFSTLIVMFFQILTLRDQMEEVMAEHSLLNAKLQSQEEIDRMVVDILKTMVDNQGAIKDILTIE